MILILNDTAHCWENETSIAASPFECPCEFIKSTSFPPVPIQIDTAARVRENIQGQKSSLAEHNVISVSLFSLTDYDNETSQIFRMAFYHADGRGKVIKWDECENLDRAFLLLVKHLCNKVQLNRICRVFQKYLQRLLQLTLNATKFH